jgi:formylglycine-generating enzyme
MSTPVAAHEAEARTIRTAGTAHRALRSTLLMVAVAVLNAACEPAAPKAELTQNSQSCLAVSVPDLKNPTSGMRYLPDGEFLMGAQPENAEEGPARRMRVRGFWIDKTEVTNAQFARFVEATGYVTLAERPLDPALYPGVPPADLEPSSIVFHQPSEPVALGDPGAWWRVVPGANWRHPSGPQSSIAGKDHLPVVHVGYEDALAYARWAGRDLPSEAEWEYAARGGLDGARFVWGDRPPAAADANVWQGEFPVVDRGEDGYRAVSSPVGCFSPNAFGLYDMAGNVWEWTSTMFASGDPSRRVAKGGSFLCADNYCMRFRPSARTAGPPDGGSSHIGFRTIYRQAPAGGLLQHSPAQPVIELQVGSLLTWIDQIELIGDGVD